MPERTGRGALAWLGLSLALVIADQVTKWIAVGALDYNDPVPVLPGLNWTLLHNYGAAFSFLSDQPGWQRWFFTVLAIVISAVLTVWLARTPRTDWRTAAPRALIIGGALGNLFDRIRLGYVVDFIDVYWQQHHWPAFNVADSAMSVGAVAMIVLSVSAGGNEATTDGRAS